MSALSDQSHMRLSICAARHCRFEVRHGHSSVDSHVSEGTTPHYMLDSRRSVSLGCDFTQVRVLADWARHGIGKSETFHDAPFISGSKGGSV